MGVVVLAAVVLGVTAAPAQVLRVFPADGTASTQVLAVGAELDFTRGHAADASSLRLVVDGVDVTAQSRVTQTRDWPPSFVSISYGPGQLSPGLHRAEIRFATATGAAVSHAWTFTIKEP